MVDHPRIVPDGSAGVTKAGQIAPRIQEDPMEDDVVHPRIDDGGTGETPSKEAPEPEQDDPDAEAVEGDGEPEDRRRGPLTAEQKLQREKSANKRLRRERAEAQTREAHVLARLERLEQERGQAQVAQVDQAESNLETQINQARAIRKQARIDGDVDKQDQCDTFIENALIQVAQIKTAKAQRQVPQVRQPQGNPAWEADWRDKNDWFEDPDEPLDTDRVKRISREIAQAGIGIHDPRHREQLDREIARQMPHRAQQQSNGRPRGGQIVAGTPRGSGSAAGLGSRGGGDFIPDATLAAYKRSGVDTNDPKWRREVREKYGAQWDRSFGRSR